MPTVQSYPVTEKTRIQVHEKWMSHTVQTVLYVFSTQDPLTLNSCPTSDHPVGSFRMLSRLHKSLCALLSL